MNRLTVTAAIAWVVAILLLWLMIKMDGDDLMWLQVGTGEPAMAPVIESVVSAAATPPALSCEQTENSLRDQVGSARHCTTDSDCTLFDFGYPIDCMTSVAKSEISALRLEYRDYAESCDFRVYFDCPAEPMQRRAVCQDNRCAVSLKTNDALEEETLEYLGLRSSGQER
jgi:hypothetical protein